MLELVNTPPHKIIFLGPGCSVATTPVAEAAPYWEAVQVSFYKFISAFVLTLLPKALVLLPSFSKIQLVVYYQCCLLIG